MKVTSKVLRYPEGESPTFQCPEHDRTKRFLLGRLGKRPLFAICMNPSAASIDNSDATANTIIKASMKLGFDGWCIANVYPVRGTDSSEVSKQPFDKGLAEENCDVIISFLQKHQIKEVWGAWGEPLRKGDPFDSGRQLLLEKLKEQNVGIFYFGQLNKSGNPHHPLYLKIDKTNQHFL